jgi:hypothetical protein
MSVWKQQNVDSELPVCNKVWKEQYFLKDVVFICCMPNWPSNSIHTISSPKNRSASENEVYYVSSSLDARIRKAKN